MEKEEEIIEQYTAKEDIDKIFALVMKNKLVKTEHFNIRVIERDIQGELIDTNINKSEKIKLIDKRKHKKDMGYDLYYELSNNQTLKLCFIPLKDKTLLINAILRHRKWQSSIRFLNRRG